MGKQRNLEQWNKHTHKSKTLNTHTGKGILNQAFTNKQKHKSNQRNTQTTETQACKQWHETNKQRRTHSQTRQIIDLLSMLFHMCHVIHRRKHGNIYIYIYRYIIICHKVYEAPKHNRWYKKDKPNWQRMHLIYAAPTSKPWRRHSTGQMETQLIDRCWHHESCINRRGAGGECPSAGDPHFVYIVVRWTSSVKTCINEHDTFSHMQQTIMILFHNRQHIHGPALFRGLHTHLWTCRSHRVAPLTQWVVLRTSQSHRPEDEQVKNL